MNAPASDRREVLRIAAAMTAVCAIAAVILAAAWLVTHRYREEADRRGEKRAILELLQLDSAATVTEVRQYLAPARREVVYRAGDLGQEAARQAVFALDGTLVTSGAVHGAGGGDDAELRRMVPLGRIFAARRSGVPAGFVVEGESRGYKNRIRFFVGLTAALEIAGVRVVEHEEDPGLGAEIATPMFQGQFVGRTADDLPALDVTRDPMPEDWRAALALAGRTPAGAWRSRNAALLARERSRPIYAVTGATISSRALTDGVRETVDHFRRRWTLIASHVEPATPAERREGGS